MILRHAVFWNKTWNLHTITPLTASWIFLLTTFTWLQTTPLTSPICYKWSELDTLLLQWNLVKVSALLRPQLSVSFETNKEEICHSFYFVWFFACPGSQRTCDILGSVIVLSLQVCVFKRNVFSTAITLWNSLDLWVGLVAVLTLSVYKSQEKENGARLLGQSGQRWADIHQALSYVTLFVNSAWMWEMFMEGLAKLESS